MKAGVLKETWPGEARVAMVPASLTALDRAGVEVVVESGAGTAAGFPDSEYAEKGASLAGREEVLASCPLVLTVRSLAGGHDEAAIAGLGEQSVVVGFLEPLRLPDGVRALAERGATTFALDLLPRITRAQSMDVLSSMATIAGYKAVLLAANELPKMFPMMMTAAGTIAPARVFVVGAGVAGLQAIASAKKLGAIVEAYDVRPAVKEQVESLGGKFVEFELETDTAEDAGGYAKELGEDFYKKQREMMLSVVGASDVVITTAAIPGKKAPILVTTEMVKGMHPGSVVVDLAAERGGNCELTKAGEDVVEGGVKIIGPINIPTTIPFHASQMYAKNVATFLLHLVDEGNLKIDTEDEITEGTLITQGGKVVNPRILDAMGISSEGSE